MSLVEIVGAVAPGAVLIYVRREFASLSLRWPPADWPADAFDALVLSVASLVAGLLPQQPAHVSNRAWSAYYEPRWPPRSPVFASSWSAGTSRAE